MGIPLTQVLLKCMYFQECVTEPICWCIAEVVVDIGCISTPLAAYSNAYAESVALQTNFWSDLDSRSVYKCEAFCNVVTNALSLFGLLVICLMFMYLISGCNFRAVLQSLPVFV